MFEVLVKGGSRLTFKRLAGRLLMFLQYRILLCFVYSFSFRVFNSGLLVIRLGVILGVLWYDVVVSSRWVYVFASGIGLLCLLLVGFVGRPVVFLFVS